MFKSALLKAIFLSGLFISLTSSANEKTGNNAFGALINKDNTGFERALAPRKFEFPADHGAHNRYRTEWWYFTGNVKNPYGRPFGYELTFFRFALTPSQPASKSSWRDNQLYMAHVALTDVEDKRFYAKERFSRAGNNLAGASNKKYHVWLQDWAVVAENESGFPLHLKAQSDQFALDFLLKSEHDPVLQGNQGLSQKSAEPGNASYYYSYPHLITEGNISIGDNKFSVTGKSWMDREWSTSALSNDQVGWDWFALQLDDNTELMFYQLRRKDRQLDMHSSGSLILSNNTKFGLMAQDVSIQVLKNWTSPHSAIVYPAGWQLTVPGQKLNLKIEPLLNDQELNLSYRYWEGAVKVSGTKNGHAISGQGYVELAGYQ